MTLPPSTDLSTAPCHVCIHESNAASPLVSSSSLLLLLLLLHHGQAMFHCSRRYDVLPLCNARDVYSTAHRHGADRHGSTCSDVMANARSLQFAVRQRPANSMKKSRCTSPDTLPLVLDLEVCEPPGLAPFSSTYHAVERRESEALRAGAARRMLLFGATRANNALQKR